jgi:imidazoleglycerol-phosphate dehydratase/histidinol-phosphatase
MTDVTLARNLGCKAIYINDKSISEAELSTTDWNDIYMYLKKIPRTAKVERKTTETLINVEINLDGSGKNLIDTGIGFFDHMLEQIARHGNIDLKIIVKGDLEIDEHHTVEDVAITLGESLLSALGGKKGIERYGFALPMDDCLAQVALDFGGRPWLIWDVVFQREKIGDMPSELFYHFFKSFSDNAKCNLNIKAEGDNEHHKIEAIFKALAKAIKMAVKQTDNFNLPTTKGSI